MKRAKIQKVTLDTYADLFDTDLDAVASTLHASYSRGLVGKVWAKCGQSVGKAWAMEAPDGG